VELVKYRLENTSTKNKRDGFYTSLLLLHHAKKPTIPIYYPNIQNLKL